MESPAPRISAKSDHMSYLRTAWRTIKSNKGFTAINIIGLTIGLCTCMAIYTITSYEFSFDTFHPDADRIYRVGDKIREHDKETYGQGVVPPTAAALRREIPGIEAAARYYMYPVGDTNAIITDGDYFTIFPYHWLAGNPATALTEPFSVVLTETQARKYFRQPPYIGRQVTYKDSLRVHVTGIVEDWGPNTDLPYTDLISLASIRSSRFLSRRFHPDSWTIFPLANPWTRTFIKLSPRTDPKQIATALPTFVNRHLTLDPWLHFLHFGMFLQPLNDIHFNAAVGSDPGSHRAHRTVLYGLLGAAVFILLLAIVNFINGSTAQSFRRARETGIRRFLGSSRWQLMRQFFTETALTTLLAALLSALLVIPVIRLFSTWLPDNLHPLDGHVLLFLLAITVLTTLLAGIYPARVLSQPALKTFHSTVRKTLIVFQFTISLSFIIGAIIFNKQLHFMLDTDPGFARNSIVTIDAPGAGSAQLQPFAAKALQVPGIEDYTSQGHAPAGDHGIEQDIHLENQKNNETMAQLQAADNNFVPFYNIRLLSGRNIQGNDSMTEVLINDTYRRELGFKTPDAALGHFLTWNNGTWPIVGVIADFHAGSFHDPIYPLVVAHLPNLRHSLAFRLAPGANTAATLQQLAAAWHTVFPNDSFKYRFLDDAIARLYTDEKRLSWLIYAATALAILISCMGLLGLILYVVERKKKEISIRKVLGAGVADIVLLLNKEFAVLIAIALAIATPIAAYGMHRWLQDYAYRTSISWWVFALAGLAALAIASLTISYRVIRAARINPVENLHTI